MEENPGNREENHPRAVAKTKLVFVHAARTLTGIESRERRQKEKERRQKEKEAWEMERQRSRARVKLNIPKIERLAAEQGFAFRAPGHYSKLGMAPQSHLDSLADKMGRFHEEGIEYRLSFFFSGSNFDEWIGTINNPEYATAQERYSTLIGPICEALKDRIRAARRREFEDAVRAFKAELERWIRMDSTAFDGTCFSCGGTGQRTISYDYGTFEWCGSCSGSGNIGPEEAKMRLKPTDPRPWSRWEERLDAEVSPEAERVLGEKIKNGDLTLAGWTTNGSAVVCSIPETPSLFARIEEVRAEEG